MNHTNPWREVRDAAVIFLTAGIISVLLAYTVGTWAAIIGGLVVLWAGAAVLR